ncbi:hypothetical protein RUND412_004182 [Rhizina undulata]
MEDKSNLDAALGNLFNLSFAKRKEESHSFGEYSSPSFWIHPLVCGWACERTDSRLRQKNAKDTLKLLSSAILSQDENRNNLQTHFKFLVFRSRVGSHLEVYREHISKYFGGWESLKTAEVSSTMGSLYSAVDQYSEAIQLHQKALAKFEKTLGEDDPSALKTVHSIADLLLRKGQKDEALKWYQRELAGKEKTLGRDDLSTLETVHHIALFFHRQERYDEALAWYRRELEGRDKTLGKDHPSTLETVSEIGWIFDLQYYEEELEWPEESIRRSAMTNPKPSEPYNIAFFPQVVRGS